MLLSGLSKPNTHLILAKTPINWGKTHNSNHIPLSTLQRLISQQKYHVTIWITHRVPKEDDLLPSLYRRRKEQRKPPFLTEGASGPHGPGRVQIMSKWDPTVMGTGATQQAHFCARAVLNVKGRQQPQERRTHLLCDGQGARGLVRRGLGRWGPPDA